MVWCYPKHNYIWISSLVKPEPSPLLLEMMVIKGLLLSQLDDIFGDFSSIPTYLKKTE